MATIQNSFDSNEQLVDIEVAITGAESATLTESDYTESGSDPYTYTAEYTANTDGDYTFTLNKAVASDGEDGANGETATVSIGSSSTVFEPASSDLDHFSGDTGNYDINSNSPTLVNTNSLKEQTGGNASVLTSTSGLSNYPSSGDVFSIYMYNTGTTYSAIFFGVQTEFTDISNSQAYHYEIDMQFDNAIKLQVDNSKIASTGISISTDSWYELEVDWGTDGTLGLTLYSVDSSGSRTGTEGSLSHTDSTYTSGGVGFATRGDGDDNAWEDWTID